MATAKVEKPVPVDLPSTSEGPVDMDVENSFEEDEDLYTKLKTLQRQLEFFDIQVAEVSTSHCSLFVILHSGVEVAVHAF
jgi:hypothetical protein